MSFRLTFRFLFLFVVMGTFGSEYAYAQEPKPRVILYKDRMQAEFDTVNVVKNAVKINPLLFFRGEIPLYYERALSPNLSIEVGVGITMRDYLKMSFGGDDADDFGAGTEIIPNLSLHGGIRYYLTNDLEPQGWYLQPTFSHLRYEKAILVRQPDGQYTDDMNYHDIRVFNDIRLLLGNQILGYGSNWLFDIYGGVGFRDRSMQIIQERIDLTASPPTYTYDIENRNDMVPAFYLGVKVGLGF